ncbi:MAG: translation elongation factor Ts [Bacteroidia bacterium]
MSITAKDVNKLRQVTGAGMMDCKKALQETNGDFEAAIDYLRKKGQKVSEKRSDREATEGVVIAKTSDDHKRGIVIALSCETDFVAKNADFIEIANKFADEALKSMPATLDELKQKQVDDKAIADHLTDQMGKIGEKIDLSEYERVESEHVLAYNHLGNKIGVLVAMSKGGSNGEVSQAGRDVAMQIAAMNPVALDKDQVDSRTVEREIEIAREQIRAEGKPDNLVDKIAEGKLNKFYKERTLLNQDFVKDPSKTVKKLLEDIDKELKITDFKRVEIGG